MAREHTSGAGPFRLQEPGQGIDHEVLRLPGAREDVHPVAVGGVLFRAAITPGFCPVPEIVVGNLIGQHTSKMLIVGL